MKMTRKPGGAGDKLQAAIEQLNTSTGKVGWFESAKYEGGQPVAGVMAVQEYGSAAKNIPPRPFFRSTTANKQNEWAAVSKGLAREIVQGKRPANQLMPALCLAAEGDVRETIIQTMTPKLSDKTVDARKRRLANKGKGATMGIEKPLVDSGIALNTLTSQVT